MARSADERDKKHDNRPSITSSLLQRVQGRDEIAWENLVYLYEPVVHLWCRRRGVRQEDVKDVGQEVFAAVANGITRFRRDRAGATFRGWLYQITMHKIQDHWRRLGKQPPAVGGSEAHQFFQDFEDPVALESIRTSAAGSEETAGLYQRALNLIRGEMNDKTWKAFLAVTIEEKPAAEVAADLGMTAGAVYVAKSRILRRLREELAELEDVAVEGAQP